MPNPNPIRQSIVNTDRRTSRPSPDFRIKIGRRRAPELASTVPMFEYRPFLFAVAVIGISVGRELLWNANDIPSGSLLFI